MLLRFALGVADLTQERLGAVLSACAAARGTPALVHVRRTPIGTALRGRAARLDRVGKLVGQLPGLPRALGRCRAWRDRWAELGRRERARNRILASDALTILRENTLARVSESPDVKSVIREQSEGIAVTAMGELRARSERADSLVEQTVGRLLRRRRSARAR